MAFGDKKIIEYGDNVKNLPDYPSDNGITAEQLKAIFDGRGDKEIKAAINGIIDELVSAGAAGQIKCADGKSIEEKLAELGFSEEEGRMLAEASAHILERDNPHEVTAGQIECADGNSVEEKISALDVDASLLKERCGELEETVSIQAKIHESDVSALGIEIDNLDAKISDGLENIVLDRIVGDTKVVAGIESKPVLSVSMDKYGNAAAYVAIDEYDSEEGIWSYGQYRELWDKWDYPNLDLTSATELTDSEKTDIRANIGAASTEEFERTAADVSSLIMDVTNFDSRVSTVEEKIGDIDSALDAILAMHNELIGGDA